VYNEVNPPIYGVTSENTLGNDGVSFAASKGVSLTKHTQGGSGSLDTVVTFISGALSNDKPVAALHATFFGDLPWHWGTITELNFYSPTTVYATISNVGNRQTINFVAYRDAAALNGGYLYLD